MNRRLYADDVSFNFGFFIFCGRRSISKLKLRLLLGQFGNRSVCGTGCHSTRCHFGQTRRRCFIQTLLFQDKGIIGLPVGSIGAVSRLQLLNGLAANALYIVDGLGGVLLHSAASDAQRVPQRHQTAAELAAGAENIAQIAGAFQPVQRVLKVLQLVPEVAGGIAHAVQDGFGIGNGAAQRFNLPLHRVQKLGQVGKVLPQSVGPIIKNALAAREDAPGLV